MSSLFDRIKEESEEAREQTSSVENGLDAIKDAAEMQGIGLESPRYFSWVYAVASLGSWYLFSWKAAAVMFYPFIGWKVAESTGFSGWKYYAVLFLWLPMVVIGLPWKAMRGVF